MHKWMLIGLMMLATAARAQQVDLKSLDKLANIAKGVTQINFDDSMVKSAAGLLNEKNGDEAAAKKAVAGMKGLHLRVFEFDKKGMYKFEDLKAVRDQLKGPDWTIFLQTREPDEQVEIWMHQTTGEHDAMLLISAEEDELVVIHALGNIRPEDLSKIGGQFGIPQIGIEKAPEPKK